MSYNLLPIQAQGETEQKTQEPLIKYRIKLKKSISK